MYPPPKFLLEENNTVNQVKPLTKLKAAELWEEIKVTEEEVWGDLKCGAQVFLKRILGGTMEDEVMCHLGISRKSERSEARETQRNGYYKRDLETELGLVRELRVPRTRDGGVSSAGIQAISEATGSCEWVDVDSQIILEAPRTSFPILF